MSTVATTSQPVFNLPVRWVLRVLSWLAFGVAAYLAWHTVTNESVAGCSVGSHNGCDAVLNSPWSKWLGIPVAIPGLACYATLAGLSVLLGIQSAASRWINTAFVLLATLAAGASLWFIGVQVFAIGDFCLFCMTTDICGIAIGAIAAWAAINWASGPRHPRRSASSANNLTALRSAMPTGTRPAPVAAARTAPASATVRTTPSTSTRNVPLVGSVATHSAIRHRISPPSMPIAFGGALAMLVVLIGGQIVFPAKPFDVQQVTLNDSIELSGSNGGKDDSEPSDGAEPRVTMRIPPEDEAKSEDTAAADPSNPNAEPPAATQPNGDGAADAAEPSQAEPSPPQAEPVEPQRERKLTFLGGKLTLDTYDQPIIGSPEAPHVVVEMVSYDCLHCRKTNRFMKQALSRYGNQVALIVLVIPFERACNKLITDQAASKPGACTTARMAVGVAKLKPAAFRGFHDYLMAGKDKPPALTSIIAKAYSIADTDRVKLRELRESKEIAKQIAGYVDLFATLRQQNASKKEFGLPIQILGDHVMSGSVEKADDIYKAWEEHLGVKPR